MATRLYFTNKPDSTTDYFPVAYVPAYDAAWGDTDTVYRCFLSTTTFDGPTGGVTKTNTKAFSGAQNVLIMQAILPGVRAQTISGNLKGILRCHEANAAADMSTQMVVRVYDPVTQTFRGTLLAAHSYAISGTPGAQGYELATVTTQRKWPSGYTGSGDALSSVDAEDGDWIVVELGVRGTEASATGRAANIGYYGLYSASDAAEDETTVTTTLNSWLEFSQTLTLGGTLVPFHTSATDGEGLSFLPMRTESRVTEGQLWPRGERTI